MKAENDRGIFLSTLPTTKRDQAIALAVVGVSSVVFAWTVPFAGVPLAPVTGGVAHDFNNMLGVIIGNLGSPGGGGQSRALAARRYRRRSALQPRPSAAPS